MGGGGEGEGGSGKWSIRESLGSNGNTSMETNGHKSIKNKSG